MFYLLSICRMAAAYWMPPNSPDPWSKFTEIDNPAVKSNNSYQGDLATVSTSQAVFLFSLVYNLVTCWTKCFVYCSISISVHIDSASGNIYLGPSNRMYTDPLHRILHQYILFANLSCRVIHWWHSFWKMIVAQSSMFRLDVLWF